MSNEFAIAAVTMTLHDILDNEILRTVPPQIQINNQIDVTTLPMAKVGKSGHNEINVFLFNTSLNGAWRNQDMPPTKPGENGRAPLALNLEYLITAAAENDNEMISHVLLGQAMRVLHDNAIVDRDKVSIPESGLPVQVERITITPHPMNVDEVSKLWTTLQSPYRASAAYFVTVVLIESRTVSIAPLPVLRRGEQDRGPVAVATPPPALVKATIPPPFTAARLGDDVTIAGQNLTGTKLTVRLAHPALNAPIDLTPVESTGQRIKIHLPDDANAIDTYVAGMNLVSVLVERPDIHPWSTNQIALPVAARITDVAPKAHALSGDPNEIVQITVKAVPHVRDGQNIRLVFGNGQFEPTGPPVNAAGQPSEIKFIVPPTAGTYVARLRVDGVDSIPVIADNQGLLQFDPDQTVTLT